MILKKRLDELGKTYEIDMDVNNMIARGLTHVPMLETDDGQ